MRRKLVQTVERLVLTRPASSPKGTDVEIAPHGARPARRLLAAATALATALGALVATSVLSPAAVAVPAATSDASSGRYVVLLSRPPAASYRGGVREFGATAPRGGATYDSSSPAARAYTRFLRAQQLRIAASVDVDPYYLYTTSLNGFAAALTAAQARDLAARDGVLAVVPDEVRHTGGWQPAGSRATGLSLPSAVRGSDPGGAGVVIGVLDTGIDSNSPAFAPLGAPVPDTYRGGCQSGRDTDRSPGFRCGDKVVGGQFFVRGQGGPDAAWSGEYVSPQDFAGHGTRTASVAAGARTRATVGGVDLGPVVGAAPAARVASYKICWGAEDGSDSCLTSDALAGIDRAVADGVDVLSYGVTGTSTDVVDPVELSFLHAADAGVFVATVAGNGGPRAASTGHPSPWTTTVGAATPDPHPATVVLGNGERYVGVSVTNDNVAQAPLVLARDAAAGGVDAADAQLCFPGSLDPATVRGAVVVCDRGTNDRVEKSAVVDQAGGAGMLLLNPTADSLDPDLHTVPTVHLPDTAYDGVYAYAASGAPATAAIRAGVGRLAPEPPAVADFSGRGPARVAGGDLLKPDLVAPGVGVLAATANDGQTGHRAAAYGPSSGTSVASAYVAGLAARLVQAHPNWSPMAVKSALMTTARAQTGGIAPFDQGAGLVRPGRALDPGLVLDSRLSDWSSYLAGQDQPGFSAPPARAVNLNVASVAIGSLAGREIVRRTFSNVSDTTSTYSVATRGMDGISVTATPSVFTLAPGAKQTIALRFVRDSAALAAYATGVVRLNDGPGGHVVRLPVALRPVGVRVREQVRLSGPDEAFTTRSGIRGTLVGRLRGPVAGIDTAANGSDTEGADFDPGMPGLWSQTVDVAGPGEWLRVQARADHRDDDLDLFLLDDDGHRVAAAASGDASETITAHGLAAGTYTIDVQPWFVADPSGETTFTVRTFQVAPRPTGSLRVDPRRQGVSPGRANTWSLVSAGRQPGVSWFGWIGWYAGDDLVGRTLVSAD